MFNAYRRIGALALGLVLIVGCTQEQSTAPAALTAPAATSPDLLGTVGTVVGTVTSTLKLTTTTGLQRTEALASPITIRQTIGAAGGILSIPAAGVTVTVPRGALEASTVITMTARAGTLVAYDFEPHGITFAKPLVFNQSLKGTNATLLSAPFLRLGYYEDPSLLGQTTAVVTELIGGLFNALNWTFTAPIRHFSGYVVSCGRGEE